MYRDASCPTTPKSESKAESVSKPASKSKSESESETVQPCMACRHASIHKLPAAGWRVCAV